MKIENDVRTAMAGSQIILGLLLLAAPWAVGFAAGDAAAWSAWLTGGAIALVGVAALSGYAHAAGWVNLVLGLWAILAPWALAIAAQPGAMWSHVVPGALTAIAAAARLWWEHRPPTQAHA